MKPVLFLDVDGVLNILSLDHENPPSSPWSDVAHHIVPDAKKKWPMWLSRNMAANIIDLLPDVELRWLTTWADYANKSVAPLLGLPEDTFVQARPSYRESWKWYAILDFMDEEPDREFIWIDDDAIFHYYHNAIPVNHLFVVPYPDEGLQPDHFVTIREWLTSKLLVNSAFYPRLDRDLKLRNSSI